jgi:hypothetical protein
LQRYVATKVILYGSAGDARFEDAIARARPSRAAIDGIPGSLA